MNACKSPSLQKACKTGNQLAKEENERCLLATILIICGLAMAFAGATNTYLTTGQALVALAALPSSCLAAIILIAKR